MYKSDRNRSAGTLSERVLRERQGLAGVGVYGLDGVGPYGLDGVGLYGLDGVGLYGLGGMIYGLGLHQRDPDKFAGILSELGLHMIHYSRPHH